MRLEEGRSGGKATGGVDEVLSVAPRTAGGCWSGLVSGRVRSFAPLISWACRHLLAPKC